VAGVARLSVPLDAFAAVLAATPFLDGTSG